MWYTPHDDEQWQRSAYDGAAAYVTGGCYMNSNQGVRRNRPARFFRKLNSPKVVTVVLVILALIGFLLYRYPQLLQNNLIGEDSSVVEGEPIIAEEPYASPEEGSGVRVAVRVINRSVRLRIMEDGQTVYDQVTKPQTFPKEFEAEKSITVTAEIGGNVHVGVNGGAWQSVGGWGEETRTFTAQSKGAGTS